MLNASNLGLTIGTTVLGDPVKVSRESSPLFYRIHSRLYQDLMKAAFENGINMFDNAGTSRCYHAHLCSKLARRDIC
jgi:aryl-alcohol dehydrogenase-like predicted oxidoreductase